MLRKVGPFGVQFRITQKEHDWEGAWLELGKIKDNTKLDDIRIYTKMGKEIETNKLNCLKPRRDPKIDDFKLNSVK